MINMGGFSAVQTQMTTVVPQLGIQAEKNDKKNEGSFANYLMDAMNTVNSQQTDVDGLAQQVITDPDSVDVHDVTIAMAKANMSLSMAQSVVDRVITAWNEVTTTR